MCAALTDLLGRASLFGELEPAELETLARAAEKREFARDEVIFAAHEPAAGLYVLASGRVIEQRPTIARKLMRELSLRLRRSNAQMESLATLDVVGRLARYFIDLARQHGQILGNGWVAVRRPTHQDIANSIGTSRETVTPLINDLEQRGLVVHAGTG